MTFRTVPDDGSPLRVVLVGVGAMGQAWLQAISDCAAVELVGLADLDTVAAQAVADRISSSGLSVGVDAVEIAARSGGQAVIDVTVPAAHHPVTTAALFAGLPVLGEKPVAASVAQGLSLAAAAEVTGELFMVSQTRRYNDQLFTFRDQLATLGRVGMLTTEFFKAPHFGGFRDEMAHPLLIDMAHTSWIPPDCCSVRIRYRCTARSSTRCGAGTPATRVARRSSRWPTGRGMCSPDPGAAPVWRRRGTDPGAPVRSSVRRGGAVMMPRRWSGPAGRPSALRATPMDRWGRVSPGRCGNSSPHSGSGWCRWGRCPTT